MIYTCMPQFYYIVGFKGVLIARTCFPDVQIFFYWKISIFLFFNYFLIKHTGHLRYLKLGCLEDPTYVEVISHSRASLPICYCISTLLVSNSVMTKTRLCRSDNLLPTKKNTISFTLPVSNFEVKNYRSDCMISKKKKKKDVQ